MLRCIIAAEQNTQQKEIIQIEAAGTSMRLRGEKKNSNEGAEEKAQKETEDGGK